MHKQKGKEFTQHVKSCFEGPAGLLRHVFLLILEKNHISSTIIKLSLVIAMLETKRFDEGITLDDTMETKDHKGEEEIKTGKCMTHDIDEFICTESQKLQVQTMDDIDDQLSDSDAIRARHILVHENIIARAKTMMKRQCCAYLKGVSLDNEIHNSLVKVGTATTLQHHLWLQHHGGVSR